jgi:hypothetical protein
VKCNPIAENAELKIESFDDEELEEVSLQSTEQSFSNKQP